jgi:hypothetical protein
MINPGAIIPDKWFTRSSVRDCSNRSRMLAALLPFSLFKLAANCLSGFSINPNQQNGGE